MTLDLSDEETRALLNPLMDTIEADRHTLSRADSDAPWHPGEIRADGTETTASGQTADAGGARPEEAASLGTAVEMMKAESVRR